ncbi:hypothetical protein OIU84_006947 [Salix udensis]|uniref:DUF4283 domain-containing protein n=1 Tax=Salix udensis TaxID=889485 RepID=A0AAD6JZN2_9ROSI|nr:hypothetical protein OIU84_006947 [Salix udensis]
MPPPKPKPNNQQTPQPSSWADKVRVSDSSTRCQLEQLARQPTGSILQIPENFVLADDEGWKRSMIGFFVGYKMPYHAVCNIANRVWKKHGLEKVTVMENGFIVFRFSSEETMMEVLSRGPWMFGGKSLILQQWQPGFIFDKNKIRSLPVWVRLHGLPFSLWTMQGLSLAASMVGRPIACDEPTIQCSRMDYARVCIELEADTPPVHHFKVASVLTKEPITVEVSYEWKPSRCSTCKVFGHSCGKTEGKVLKEHARTQDGTVEILNKTKVPQALDGEDPLPNGDPRTSGDYAQPSAHGLGLIQQTKLKGKSVVIVHSDGSSDTREGSFSRHQEHNAEEEHTSKGPCLDIEPLAIQPRASDQGEETNPLTKCVENRMDTISSGAESKGKDVAATASSSNENHQVNHKGAMTPSPKTKKKKGKKRREASSLC